MFCSKILKIDITYNPSSTKLVLSSRKSLSFVNNYCFFYRRKATMTMAMTSTVAIASTSKVKENEPTVKLTASRTATNGRINGLVSLRAWKALIIMLINTLLWFFLLPYRRRWRTVSEKGSGGGGSCNVGGGGAAAPEVSARRALAIKRVLQDNEDDDDDDGTDAATATAREFSLFVTSRGDIMFTQSWTPLNTQTRGLVVILHGLNEHSGRYKDLAKRLNANGYKVYGMDWVGHGGSDGLHAYVHSLDVAVDDMKSFIGEVLSENPSLPCFCFGHSTGAAIILKAVLDPKFSSRISGVVLTSPAVGVQPSHPIIAIIAPVLSFLLPRYQFSAANKRGIAVSRDPKALEAKYSDPLVFTGSIRVRTGYEILRITAFLQQNLRKLTVPFLVLHGTADTVTDPDASKKLYQEAASTDKTIKLYDGLLHDLLFEPEREEVLEDIIAWLNSRLQC